MKHFFILFFIFWWGTNAFSQVINTFPYNYDFENETQGSTGAGAPYTLSEPGWENDPSVPGVDWVADAGGTGSGGTGPSVDQSPGTSTGFYMYIESSTSGTGYPNIPAGLLTPYFDLTSLSGIEFNFWYHMLGATMGTMEVQARVGSSGAWTTLWGPNTDNQDLWVNVAVDASAYAGQDSVRFRIYAVTGTSFTSDFAIDNITVFEPPPYDLSFVDLTGYQGCGQGDFPISGLITNLGTDSIPTGSELIITYSDTNNLIIDTILTSAGIAPGDTFTHTFGTLATFSAGIVTQLGSVSTSLESNTSNDSITKTIDVLPIVSTFPYFEDFENGNGSWIADNGLNGTWELTTPNNTIINSAASGSNAWVTNSTGLYNANEDGTVNSPCFDFSGFACTPYIDISVWWNSEFSWDGMNLQYSIDGGASWQNVGEIGEPSNWYNDNSINANPGGSQEGWTGRNATSNGSDGWVRASHALDGLAGQSQVKLRVNFGSDGSVNDEGVAFDDIYIYEGINLSGPNIPSDAYNICLGDTSVIDSIQLSVGGESVANSILSWSTGDSTNSIWVYNSGVFTLTRSDTAGGCVYNDSVTITGYSIPSVDLGPDTSVCLGTMIDAGPALSHVWSTGDSSQMITIVASDTFWVTASNPACPATSDTVVLTAATPPSVSIAIANSLDCYNSTNGVLNALDSGGTGAVTFQWDAAANNQTAQSASGLTGGSYSVTATDALGCSASTSYSLIAPDTLMVDIVLANALDCHDSANGVLNALDSGGTGAVTFQWDAAANNQTAQSASGLTGGTYFVTATDANGCTNVDSFALLTPDSITVLPDSLANVSCSGGSDGVIQVTTLGGTPTYTYLWSNGATTEDLVGIPAGLYSGTITDANGCTFSASLPITEPTQLVASATDLGNGQAANANGSGGTPPYSFQWDAAANNQTAQTASNLTPGTYSVTVTDANGCSDDTTVTILATNINTIAGIGKLNMFPNPASSQIVVDIELDQTNDVAIRIMNVTGQLLFEKQLGAIETQREVLDIRSLVNGVYTVQIHIGAELISKKLIVSKQ